MTTNSPGILKTNLPNGAIFSVEFCFVITSAIIVSFNHTFLNRNPCCLQIVKRIISKGPSIKLNLDIVTYKYDLHMTFMVAMLPF